MTEHLPWLSERQRKLPKWAQREISDLEAEIINFEMAADVNCRAREIMQFWTGTNCTFADDDVAALGILAGHAIRAGLHRDAEIPKSLIRAIDQHVASAGEAYGRDPEEGLDAKHEHATAEGGDAQGEAA